MPLLQLIIKRCLLTVPLLWLVLTLTFVVVHATPGSYADLIVGEHTRESAQAREKVLERWGLDLPLYRQYFRWLAAASRADLGQSFSRQRPVTEVIGEAVAPTLALTLPALLINLGLGTLLAVAALRRPFGWFDRVTSVLSLGVYGLPSFWVAGLAVLVFASMLGWFPASHMSSVHASSLGAGARAVDLLHHLILPVGCLGLLGAAATARYLRTSLLELRQSRFILAARARGLPERRVLWVHTLRPALLPMVTLLGLDLPILVSGSVVIEVIFSWPGMGRLLWQAAMLRDVPLIMGTTLVGATFVVLGTLLADILYVLVDPRTREPR